MPGKMRSSVVTPSPATPGTHTLQWQPGGSGYLPQRSDILGKKEKKKRNLFLGVKLQMPIFQKHSFWKIFFLVISEFSGEQCQCHLHLHLWPLQQEKDMCFSARRFLSPSGDHAWLFPSIGHAVFYLVIRWTAPLWSYGLHKVNTCAQREVGGCKGSLFPAPEEVRRACGFV